MHLSVAKLGGEENVLTVEISSDLSLKDFKAVIEAESDFGITAEQMVLFYEGSSLSRCIESNSAVFSRESSRER